ncbi:YeeC-like protein [Streptococcus varani]|uniref:YeeC-like protein n=1 Tax=Streptococcus varani TaxID=1608583 RepID=A0A0E4H9A0_9STRE|nr:GIY-YIG nuclease family protein [Streptococcus varani]CQR25843.1 YeeC-like protein [Streptococcus varani]
MNDELEDILSDDSLFEDFSLDDSLFNTSRYQRTVSVKTKSHQRKSMGSHFDRYRNLFIQVRDDITNGNRQIRKISDVEISQNSPIKQDNFYIDNGVLLYVDRIYNPETGQEVSESTDRKYKVHTVYENGTENHIWLLSLVSSLYDKKRNGRLVTERIENIDIMGEKRITTGYIYVLKYAGTDERFLKMDNLYKIGYAKNIKQRLSNTVNESTYLYAPVRLITSFEIQNLEARKVELYLHHALENHRVMLSLTSPSGREITINEWFAVRMDEVTELVQKLVFDLQAGM